MTIIALKSTKRSGKSRKIAFDHYTPICIWCGVSIPDLLEVAHIDHQNNNDDPKNLVFLCSTHHRMLDLGLIPARVVTELRDNQPKADWSILIKGVPSKSSKKTASKQKPSLPSIITPESEIEKTIISRREAALKAWATRRAQNPEKFGKPTKEDLVLLEKMKKKNHSNKSKITRSLAAYKAQRTRKLENPKKYGKITESLIKNIKRLEEKLLEYKY